MAGLPMLSLRRALAQGNTPLTRFVRRTYLRARRFALPMPRFVGRPLVIVHHGVRGFAYALRRTLLAEPLFKAACASVGRNVHTGIFVHWILGDGDIYVGDDSTIDGRSSIVFGARGRARPVLRIGRRTYVGHACSFTVAEQVSIGDDVYVASGVAFLDSPGHPVDPGRRLAKQPPDPEQVRPVHVGDNVWIGTDVMVMPGVTIGEGSVIAARAVVTSDVPPYTLAGGVPARHLRTLDRPVGPEVVAAGSA